MEQNKIALGGREKNSSDVANNISETTHRSKNEIVHIKQVVEKDDSSPLWKVVKDFGKDKTIITIGKYISEYLNFSNQRSSMNMLQVKETAELILEEYPYATTNQLKLFFKMAKLGKFGADFNRMNGSILIRWFENFLQDVGKQIDDYEYNKHLKAKEGLDKLPELSEEEREDLHQFLFKLSHGGKSEEQYNNEQKIKKIRASVIRQNINLTLQPNGEEEIKKIILEKIKEEGLETFYQEYMNGIITKTDNTQ